MVVDGLLAWTVACRSIQVENSLFMLRYLLTCHNASSVELQRHVLPTLKEIIDTSSVRRCYEHDTGHGGGGEAYGALVRHRV